MADKGGTGTNTFELTVKVELLGKNKVSEHVLEQLQKAFQEHIANLQQHLQSYPELQSQHIHCVTNKKKYLGFEFWLRSAKALEQLKISTENDSLVNALSDFSDKKALGLDIGLDSQHLCFKCKIEKKQYLQGQAYFMESSGESSAEESEETDDKKQPNAQPEATSSSAEAKQEKVFGGLKKEEMAKKSTSQDTSKVKEMASFFETSNSTGKEAPVKNSTQSGKEEAQLKNQQKQSEMPQSAPGGTGPKEKKEFGDFKTEETTAKKHKLQSSANGGNVNAVGPEGQPQSVKTPDEVGVGTTMTAGANVHPTGSPSDKEIVKYFYIYLPFKDSEIGTVVMESDCKELHGARLSLVSNSKHLWVVRVMLNPNVLDKQSVCHFVVEKIEDGYFSSKKSLLRDDSASKIDCSTIQRMFWKKISEHGFLCHSQHIMLHCHEDMKDSILQMEALVTVVSPNLNNREVSNVVKDLQKETLLSDKKSLMFGVMVGIFKERERLIQVVNNDVIHVLFHALCQLKKTDVPVSSLSYLHELSYFVMQRKYGKEFCLILWMKHMYPFQDESKFLEEIKWFLQHSIAIATSDDEKTTALTINVCTVIKNRIQNGESGKGPELLLTLMKNLPLSAAMKVYSQSFDKETGFTEIKEKIVDGLVSKICACALKHFNDNNIGKLKYLWDHVKIESYAQSLTATFEKHILGLLSKTYHLNDDYIAFFKDEILFVKGPNQESLLQLIAKSPTRAIHQHMIALAQLTKYIHVIDTVTETWLETAITQYASSGLSSQRPVSMYSYLWDAISLQQDKNDEKLVQKLENKLYKMKIKYLKPADLLKIADQIFNTSKDTQLVQDIFQQHLMRLVREQHGSEDTVEILISIFGRDLWINANWQASVVTTLLDLYGMKDGRPTQVTVFSMLPHQNFWKAVLKVQGELARKVKTHQTYIAAKDCITSLRKSLKEMMISVGFIEKVASENLMLQVASFLSDDDFPAETCQFLLKECHSSVKKQREMVSLVRSTLRNITKYFPGVDGLGMLSVKKRVEMVAEVLQTGTVTVKDMKETLWQPYDGVPSICEKLQIPSKSNVFWKVCIENKIGKDMKDNEAGDALKELESEESIVEVEPLCDGDGIPALDGLLLLNELCEKGCDLYKKIWEDFYKGNDLSISSLHNMFSHGVNIPEEIKYIEDFEGKLLSSVSKNALLDYWNLQKYEHTIKAMKSSLSAFKIDTVDDEFNNALQAFEDLAKGDADSITLFHIHFAVKTVKYTSRMLNENAIDMLNILGESSTLIGFLSDIVDEDIRNLIDAVEEVSEKYVKESTVSGLIEVKRFLHPFLIKDSQLRQNQDVFFRAFAEKFQELVFKDAVLKTTDCRENVHNLRSLYNNVANRSERTREIIQNIIDNGIFCFSLKHHECMLTVTYKHKKNISTYSKASLIDLRSRALLLMNTARKDNPEKKFEDKQEYLGKYVTYIDLGFEIAELCTSLYVAGHFGFTKFDEQVQPDDLEECKFKMKEELLVWQKNILQCREEYYYMNFLLGGQIQTWYNYLQNETCEGKIAADLFMKFIHPLGSIEAVCIYFARVHSNILNQEVLMNMGMALEKAFKSLVPVRRWIESSESSLHITESVQKGKLLIVSLDEDSKLMVRTVLGLYQSNGKTIPEAHQVLFCRSETTWDEIDLLLKRCLGASKFGTDDSLFCLANVEMLSNENQFQLVDELRKLSKDGAFLLAIIFRGAEHHPFLHEFSDCVTHIHPMTEASLQKLLQKECPEIFIVTSDVPGLGKTETIKRHAHRIRKKCVTFHISGPLSKHTLVERLSKLNIKEDVVLHIDIGNTPDTEELDTFLFELLVLHYVSAYTTSVFLTTSSVCIELANTMNNTLPNSLPITTSFNRKNIKWEGFTSFQVSTEMHSPLQVVCHYLNAVEDGTLDKKDVNFIGTKALKPLPMEKCIFLIQKYFRMSEDDISYTLINSFVRVLADQLKKLSCSSYFRISNLSLMLGRQNRQTVKTDLVRAMVDVSVDFAGRSVKGCRETQKSTAASSCPTNLATSLATRVEGMIRWEHSNHLVFLFHSQDVQTLSVLYRNILGVPPHIRSLFEQQMKKKLPDFAKMHQKELQDILQKVARSKKKCVEEKELQEMAKYYALTPDNLLKMVLIMLRIRAHIPVIVMGETGCGKTSLIQYLSQICDVEFNVKTIHAGIEEKDIIKTVEDINSHALQSLKTGQQIWLFLDEINTNDHIWLLSDIICHHSCLGRKLAPNLVLMAACNPYRLRSESSIHTAGLDDKARTDELSRLLYRVHPLPETMVDYVWDFGSLSRSDEKMYIEQMVCGKLGLKLEMEMLLADALVISQEFIRTIEGVNCCVSLRDVRRCTNLTVWLKDFLCKKKKLKASNQMRLYSSSEIEIRAIILALAHCYHSRLIDSRTRQKYREALFGAFVKHHESMYMEDKIKEIIREEQEDILNRMELPQRVAKNTALQENVFVILVCILNRIPIFVVGKPGCSKSLSMQVIRSNLRGPDSKDELFRLLPQLYCVSFQGSESSTSDGIIKVFEKAQKYQESNSQEDVLSVVILDEIGLAEVSRFNPLKVLHSLLEPVGKPHPDVAVVGISNWALDASKMNRAIHLSRPEMDEEELIITGNSISSSFTKSSEAHYSRITWERDLNMSLELKGIARGYFEFVSKQRFKNFFGLRDYYSLVKCFARELANMTDYAINEDVKGNIIMKGIQRNFGGLPSEIGLVRACFEKHIDALRNIHVQQNVPVLDLIKENVSDRSARHLLLITTGDSVLGILEKLLRDQGRENVTIFGSKFEEDLTDDYSYRILSRIILCMEQGLVLILKDLETVYGSLYDMLNQNYTIVGNKKNCRIALGPYSNPMCYVHDDFKCIVLVEESELDQSDPPFLNRFEKQSLQYSEILGDENEKVVLELEQWVSSVSTVSGKHFSPRDIIPVFSKDMIPSLVLHVCSQIPSECQTIQGKMKACKLTLLKVLKPEAIARLGITDYGKTCSNEEVEELKQSYFRMPIHEGLEHFLESEIGTNTDGVGKMIIVFTNSNIHTDLKKMIPGFKCQIEKLGAFKSEKQLTMQMEQFWHSSSKELLFLQCKADIDGAHILLSKSIIEKLQAEYIRRNSKDPKHVCVIVHLGRRAEEAKTVPQIDFLAKWRLVMLDSLSKPKTKLPELLEWNLMETIELKRPLNDYIKEQLFTAFACIRYGTVGRSVDSISHIITEIRSSPEFLSYLECVVLKWIEEKYASSTNVDSWQIQVAYDANALYTASSFIDALEGHILSIIFDPLAMVIYELEKQNLLDSFFVSDSSAEKRQCIWYEFFRDKKMFAIDNTPLPKGPECYAISTPVVKLHMPFSKLCFERIEEEREYFSELLRRTLQSYEADEVEDLDSDIVEGLCFRFSDIISRKLGELLRLEYDNCQMDYLHDFCTLAVARHSPEDITDEKINVMYCLLPQRCKVPGVSLNDACTLVHTAYWKSINLIMSEFAFIETCRELIDIHDVLQEILTLNEEGLEKRYYAESGQGEDVEGNIEKEASVRSSGGTGGLENNSTDYEANTENIESTRIDKESVIDGNYEIILDSSPNHLKHVGDPFFADADVLAKIVTDSSAETNDNLNNCSSYILKNDSEQYDRLEAACISEGKNQNEDGYKRNLQASLADDTRSELSKDPDASDSVRRMFNEISLERHLSQESKDALLIQEKTLDGKNNITVGVQFLHSSVPDFIDTERANECIRDRLVMEITSSTSLESEADNRSIDKPLEEAISVINSPPKRDTQDTFQHVLVDKLCKKILPSEKMFSSDTELEKWNIKVQNILSLAGRVSKDCSVLYGLRFCSDLTSLVLIPYKMGSFWLVQLGNLLQRDVAMDTEEFMEKITEMLIFFGSSNVKEQDQQKIFSQFILRCLQAYEDSNVIDWFLYMVEKNAVPDAHLAYLKSSLHYISFIEMAGNISQNIFCQILDLDQEEACELLQESKFLSSLNSSIENQVHTSQHNISLSTLLVDVFEQEIFHSLLLEMETLMTETAIGRLLKVERIILTEEFSLRQIIAVAYFRRFVKTLGVGLQKEDPRLNQSFLQKLDACLRGNENDEEYDKRLSLQLFLLKILKSNLRFAKFNKLCQNLSGKLTFITSLWKCKSLINSTDNAPLALYKIDFHRDVRNAFESSNDDLESLIKKAISDSRRMLSLHSVLMQQFFLKRVFMELTDSDRTKANEVEELCKGCEMDEYNFRLVQFHLGKRDYENIDVLNMNLHQGSRETDIQIATFIIELASLALSSSIKGNNLFLKCFLHPEEVSGVFLPGIEVTEPNKLFCTAPKIVLGSCISHHRFACSSIDVIEDQCPKCTSHILENNAPITETPYRLVSGINGLVPGTKLTTVAQRLLQMIIHGLLTASLAAGYSNPSHISSLVQKGKDEGCIAQYLYHSVEKAFRYLENVMGIRQTDLDHFLHVLLSRTTTLLWETHTAFIEESERNIWENSFSHIVNSLIHERFSAVCEGKQQIMALHNIDETDVEHQVEEISEVGWCPYLFRLTLEPALENLSLELYHGNKTNSFPFLALVLESLPQLELIQHIKPLISWHKACVMYASYHKKKADCIKSDFTVSSFIREEDNQNQREMLKRKFDLCKKAWEAVRGQVASMKALPAMERLHDLSKLENCLILAKSSPMYKVLEVLVTIQNNFINETLALSVQNYVPALHFLQKDTACAYISCVPVADVKKDHIINFQWSDRYLKFSQCKIQYGQGRKISYDFRTIEMELANSLLLGKGYLLLEESFPRIVFTDELYKTYIFMIHELKGVIPQQKLQSDIEAGILSRRERDPKLIADFFNHLGIIMSLLRRTGGKKETPLVEFVDNWSSVLTRPFPKQVLPSPEDAIRLCHIVALNELLEELNADGIIDSLEDEYRVPLEGSAHTFIDGFLSRSVLMAEVVLKAEKRFVHRCLLYREVASMDSLLDHLKDNYFWPEGSLNDGCLEVGSHSILLEDLFPANVQVKHINSYVQFLKGKIEYLKSKDPRIKHGTSAQSIPGKISSKSLAKKKQKRLFSMET
ncbi:hypothetical protein CHS0354_002416 [Potamilus streckersoni]|uniref:AAA+ ATPase domain-containing protein n=1 Tax=Potamilus streckersoni TaxID=2493646 RepID=A0AAE0T9J9_9BIVA|nr:hypothetical protein CHS0354_002416 [Potamilus streckersoni]